MHGPCLQPVYTAVLLVLVCCCSSTGAIDRLPAQIPTLNASPAEAMQQCVQALDAVNDPLEKQRTLTRVLYDVRELEPRYTEVLAKRFASAAIAWTDAERAHGASEMLHHLTPDEMAQLADGIQDERVKGYCLRHYVSRSQYRPPAELRPLLDRVKDPERRKECLGAMIGNQHASLVDVKVMLKEAKEAGWSAKDSAGFSGFSLALKRFIPERFDEVLLILHEELPPDLSVRALASWGSRFDYEDRSPVNVARCLDAAVTLVPTCAARDQAAITLLHHGLARHRPQLALELFDKEIEPPMKRMITVDGLPNLAPAGIDEVLKRGERLAIRFKFQPEEIQSFALGRIASSSDPTPAVAWLKSAPPSALRDAAVAKIAGGLAHRASQGHVKAATVQQHADWLARLAVEIKDGKLRAAACEQVYYLVRSSRTEPVVLPPAIRESYAAMWPTIEAALEPDQRLYHIAQQQALLPLAVQEQAVQTTFDEGKIRLAAALVRGSFLSREGKLRWYRGIALQARAIPAANQRSATLAGVAKCLLDIDPDQGLVVLWEGLRVAQAAGLKKQYHDVGDSLGSVTAYVTPDECLRSTIDNAPLDPVAAIAALWSFARTLDVHDEREAVVQMTAELLLRQNRSNEAAGVAESIADPARRARVWAAVATVKHGKPLRSDW